MIESIQTLIEKYQKKILDLKTDNLNPGRSRSRYTSDMEDGIIQAQEAKIDILEDIIFDLEKNIAESQ